MRNIIDISPAVSPETAVFGGDTAFHSEPKWQIDACCPVNVATITLSPHCGAHADAPKHYHPEGKTIDQVPLEPYIGDARVIDVRHADDLVRPEHIESALESCPSRVLLRILTKDTPEQWPKDFAGIAPASLDVLAKNGVILIGVDTPSIDPEHSKTLDAHHTAHKHDIRILEHLCLSSVHFSGKYADFELIALPIKWKDLDAAPVRAILRT